MSAAFLTVLVNEACVLGRVKTHTLVSLQKLCCHSSQSFCMTLDFPWEPLLLRDAAFPFCGHKCQKKVELVFFFFFLNRFGLEWDWNRKRMRWSFYVVVPDNMELAINSTPASNFFSFHPLFHPLFFSVQAVKPANPAPAIPQVFVTMNYICN